MICTKIVTPEEYVTSLAKGSFARGESVGSQDQLPVYEQLVKEGEVKRSIGVRISYPPYFYLYVYTSNIKSLQ